MLRRSSWIVGAAGLVLTLVSWWSEPAPPGLELFVLVGLCAIGGMLPVRMPGLQPMPLSLPLVGAVAIASDTGAAMLAGFAAGWFTAFAPRRGSETHPAPSTGQALLRGFGLAGLLSLGAGMVASGYTRFGLLPVDAAAPFTPPLLEAVRSLGFSALVFWLAWCAARLTQGDLRAALPSALAWSLPASIGVAALSMIVDAARTAWGGVTVMGIAAGAAFAAMPMSWRLARQERELASMRNRARTGLALVESIALAIEAKDHTSERHLRRMRAYCLEIGRRLGLKEHDLESLEYAALLHDVGKLVVPESILSKPASLSQEEYQLMAAHARVGAEILESTPLSANVARMVRHHHERYDGSGYPDGLMGMEIPLGARILAAVDTFEALTSRRPHRQGLPAVQAAAWLESQAGILFDPRITRVLLQIHESIERQVVAEEAARSQAGERPASDSMRMRRPLQPVLDRIASSNIGICSLQEINQVLGKSLSLDETCRLVAARLERMIRHQACAIYLVDDAGETLTVRFAAGVGAARLRTLKIPIGQKVTGWVAAQRRALATWPRALDITTQAHPPCLDLEEAAGDPGIARLCSAVAAPMVSDEKVIGVITLYDDAGHAYSDQDEQLLALVARQVAGAVRPGLAIEQSQETALTDALTGLPNGRYLRMAFEQEFSRARQEGQPLTVMVMNLDGFRGFNDDFGHSAGDRFLCGVARAIRSQMRVCDTCIRHTGDEFVAIMPRLAPEEMDSVAERLTEAARDYMMEVRPGRSVRLGLSLGWASMPADGQDFETLLEAATSRMRQGKSRRRAESARSGKAIHGSLSGGGRRLR